MIEKTDLELSTKRLEMVLTDAKRLDDWLLDEEKHDGDTIEFFNGWNADGTKRVGEVRIVEVITEEKKERYYMLRAGKDWQMELYTLDNLRSWNQERIIGLAMKVVKAFSNTISPYLQ